MAATTKQEDATFSRADLEHCARQAVISGVHRRPGFSLLAYAATAEPWRYGGRAINPILAREHGARIARLVDEAERQQGTTSEEAAKPNAAELRVAERMQALAALPLDLLRRRIEEAGREPPEDALACVMLGYSLGVSDHG